MTRGEIASVIANRFAQWGRKLADDSATPLMVLGLDTESNSLVICTCEEATDEMIEQMLSAARALLARRKGGSK